MFSFGANTLNTEKLQVHFCIKASIDSHLLEEDYSTEKQSNLILSVSLQSVQKLQKLLLILAKTDFQSHTSQKVLS